MSAIVRNCNSTKVLTVDKNKHVAKATVCISNSQYIGFGGPCVSAVSPLFFLNSLFFLEISITKGTKIMIQKSIDCNEAHMF